MASGNFIIGNTLSLEGFDKYIQPNLEKKGYSVSDKIAIFSGEMRDTILTSIVGEGDLEKELNNILIETGASLETEFLKKGRSPKMFTAYGHQISRFSHHEKKEGKEDVPVYKGTYETIGVYQDDNAASQLFPSIAQGYLLKKVEMQANEVIQTVKSLLNTKMSDL